MKQDKISGFFKEFKMDKYHAWNNEKQILVWISNGFFFFKDSSAFFSSAKIKFKEEKPFLTTLNIFERYTFWKELRKEIKKRTLK